MNIWHHGKVSQQMVTISIHVQRALLNQHRLNQPQPVSSAGEEHRYYSWLLSLCWGSLPQRENVHRPSHLARQGVQRETNILKSILTRRPEKCPSDQKVDALLHLIVLLGWSLLYEVFVL